MARGEPRGKEDTSVSARKGTEARDFWGDQPRFMDNFISAAMRPWRMLDWPMDLREDDGILAPRIDMTDTEKGFRVVAELPGVKEDDIKVEVRNGCLWIHGEKREERKEERKDMYCNERRFGSFERCIQLPSEVDYEKAEATFKDGVLTLNIPTFPGAQTKVKKIPIKH